MKVLKFLMLFLTLVAILITCLQTVLKTATITPLDTEPTSAPGFYGYELILGKPQSSEEEYWECYNALCRAFYEIPQHWATALAKYVDYAYPFDASIGLSPQTLETVNLGINNFDVALYWVIAWDEHGIKADSSVVDSESGSRLVWPVVNLEEKGKGFAQGVSGMASGEIREFTAYEDYYGVLRYVVMATPNVSRIKELSLRFDYLSAR